MLTRPDLPGREDELTLVSRAVLTPFHEHRIVLKQNAYHPFYRWESPEANMRAIMEADRHLSAGSLEYIPFEEVRGVAESTMESCIRGSSLDRERSGACVTTTPWG